MAPAKDATLQAVDTRPQALARLAATGGLAVDRARALLADWCDRCGSLVHGGRLGLQGGIGGNARAGGTQPKHVSVYAVLPAVAAAADAATAATSAANAACPQAWPACEVAWWSARADTLAEAARAAAEPAAVVVLAIGAAAGLPERAKAGVLLAEVCAFVDVWGGRGAMGRGA